MNWTSILAIYFLVWVMCAFLMLPFGMRTADEAGIEKVPGQADSAPVDFRPGRVAGRGALLAAILTGIFVANYEYGWIGIETLDVTNYIN